MPTSLDNNKVFDGITAAVRLEGNSAGPLVGKTFVAKDLFDVAGLKTSAGNPEWERTHPEAKRNAVAIDRLLDAGATMIGRACTDELAFSLDGINIHYGTPVNPNMPDRIPGGSSSGSASVVAAGLADFALGSDTAGSIRVPASYCRIFGFRPSAGVISTGGVVPLSPTYDTVSWFARDPIMLRQCAEVLFSPHKDALEPAGNADPAQTTLLIAEDAFATIDPQFASTVYDTATKLGAKFKAMKPIQIFHEGQQTWMDAFRFLKDWESWQLHGEWATKHNPNFAPSVRLNFEAASKVTVEQVEQATTIKQRLISYLDDLLQPDTVMCLPTTWNLPPLREAPLDQLRSNRSKNYGLCCVASLARIPAVNIPAPSNLPSIGLSLLAGRHRDLQLLQLLEPLERLLV